MEKLLDFWKDTYFLDPLAHCIALCGICVYQFNKESAQSLNSFSWYLFLYLLLMIPVWGSRISFFENQWPTFVLIRRWYDCFLTISEFLIFQSFFIKNTISFAYFIKLLKYVFLIIAFLILLASLINKGSIGQAYLFILFTVQSIFLIVSSAMQLVSLYLNEQEKPLEKFPAFWIGCGVFYFHFCTLPLSFLINFHKYDQFILNLTPVFICFYCLLFSLIIKSFLCRVPIK